jgi:hypothetical protein
MTCVCVGCIFPNKVTETGFPGTGVLERRQQDLRRRDGPLDDISATFEKYQ